MSRINPEVKEIAKEFTTMRWRNSRIIDKGYFYAIPDGFSLRVETKSYPFYEEKLPGLVWYKSLAHIDN